MSQGLTWIAGRRIPLLALVALTALTVGLFAVINIASAAPALVVSIDDSDNVVKAGDAKTINLSVQENNANTGDYTIEYITVSGGLHVASVDTDLANADDDDATLVVPSNAAGEYTITAGVFAEGATPERLTGELTITVGDVGTPIGSVEVVLGKVDDQGAHSTDTTATIDKALKGSGSNIAVTVNVLNSLGNKPNASEVTQVLVFAPAGTVGPANANGSSGTLVANSNTAGDDPTASENFHVSKAAAGTIDVYAVAIGTGGTATSSTLTLTYTGAADTIALSDVSSPLPTSSTDANDGADPPVVASGFATLKITAVDASGNKATLDATASDPPVASLSIGFTDADDNPVDTITATLTQALAAGQTECDDTASPSTCDGTTVLATLTTTGAAPGTYTMEATFGEKEAVTTEVIVSGAPANIELSSSHETVSLGNIVTITASVTDKDGHAVTNENSVTFVAVGSLELKELDSINPGTKHGEAKIRYVVIKGSGTATIIASDAAAGGTADAVIAISTAVEEAAAVDEPDPEPVDGLSRTQLNNFASWSGEGSVSASELLAGISGASGVLYYDGDSWQRYGVVDGQVIPGSRNFTVRDGDVIWISG